jgi:hypothetical protein
MNCFCGEAGARIGSITFSFADGSMHSVEIVVGKNVRDYYQTPKYVSSISDSTVTKVIALSAPTWIHLDMRSWILSPELHARPLCTRTVTIRSTGRGEAGRLFFGALTATRSQGE